MHDSTRSISHRACGQCQSPSRSLAESRRPSVAAEMARFSLFSLRRLFGTWTNRISVFRDAAKRSNFINKVCCALPTACFASRKFNYNKIIAALHRIISDYTHRMKIDVSFVQLCTRVQPFDLSVDTLISQVKVREWGQRWQAKATRGNIENPSWWTRSARVDRLAVLWAIAKILGQRRCEYVAWWLVSGVTKKKL